jgi:hypothetical protein
MTMTLVTLLILLFTTSAQPIDTGDLTPPVINYSALALLRQRKQMPAYVYTVDTILKSVVTVGVPEDTVFKVRLNKDGDGPDTDDQRRKQLSRGSNGVFYLSNCGYLCKLKPDEVSRVMSLLFSPETRADPSAAFRDNRGFIPFGGEAGVSSFFESKEGFSYSSPESAVGNRFPEALEEGDVEFLEKVYVCRAQVWGPRANSLWG